MIELSQHASTLSSFHNEVDEESPTQACSGEEGDAKPAGLKPFLLAVVSMVSLGGLLYGLDMGSVGATFVMHGFRHHVHWDCEATTCSGEEALDKGMISFFFGIGATVGSVFNPYFAEKYGRRPSLALSTAAYLFGALMQTYLPTMAWLWIGRFFVGAGVGMLSMVAPVYVAECAPTHMRGSLGILYDLATSCGILLGSAANIGLKDWHHGWRVAYGVGLPFAALLLVALLTKMIPESPRWLAAHGTEEELTNTLASFHYQEDRESVAQALHSEVREKQEMGEASWGELLSVNNMMRRRVTLGVFFFAVQQLSGAAAVTFYAPEILNVFFEEDQAILGTVGLAVLGFLATLISVFTVDRLGRTKLLVYGGLSMVLCLVPLAVSSSLDHSEALGWTALTLSGVYIFGMSLSWGPCLYVLCPEMFPYSTRGKATGVTTMSHWLFFTIVSSVFPIASTVSLTGCFIGFAVCTLAGVGAVYFLQVETSGKSFDQIDEAFLLHKPTLIRKDW